MTITSNSAKKFVNKTRVKRRPIMANINVIMASLLLIELANNWVLMVEGSRSDLGQEPHLLRHHKAKNRRHRSSDDCLAVSQALQDQPYSIPVKKFYDADLEICKRHSPHATCCSRSMERALSDGSVTGLMELIGAHGALLKDLLTRTTDEYQHDFIQLLETSRTRVKALLINIYKIPGDNVREFVDELFKDMTSYLRHERSDINDMVDKFFDVIFPFVYIQIQNNSAAHLTSQYRQCVTDIRQEIQPYGFASRRTAMDLSKSLKTARSLLDAFLLAAEVINATDHIRVSRSCSDAATRLMRCPLCEGHVDVRPCENFCTNVMRGCLMSLSQMNPHWNEFIEAVEQTSSSMRGSHDIQHVLMDLHTEVSKALDHANITLARYHSSIISKCGQIPTNKEGSSPHASQRAPLVPSSAPRQGPEIKLSTKIEMFVKNLAASKNFFIKMPDSLCSSEPLSAGNYEICWNGTHLGPYARNVTVQNIWAQVDLNPEVKVNHSDQFLMSEYTEKLDRTEKLLRSTVVPPPLMYGDENLGGSGEDGSGGLRPYPPGVDDEDAYWSGSGDGSSGDGDSSEIPWSPSGTSPDIDIVDRSTPKTPSPYHPTKVVDRSTPKTPSPYHSTKVPQREQGGGGKVSGACMTSAPLAIILYSICLVMLFTYRQNK